jgi:hypothetical protein
MFYAWCPESNYLIVAFVSEPTYVSFRKLVCSLRVTAQVSQLHETTGEIMIIINEVYYEIRKREDSCFFPPRLFRKAVAKCFVMFACLSVCPHATAQLPLEWFSWNFLFTCYWNLSAYFDVSENSTKLTDTSHEDLRTCVIISGRHWRLYSRQ